uniref:Uncharacterized protein n=1 Tax=Candidatus Kentrum sp. FW TaxID=2126338 RepID=A0A450TUJ6_9GAMM|nr:MAG: hypothetical protein BECKFW1821C_GA0114237_10352 [Candidatus Kentron sp. FW]
MAGKTEIAVFVARIFIIDPLEIGNLFLARPRLRPLMHDPVLVKHR